MTKLDPTDPRWTKALDAYAAEWGMDVRQVLPPTYFTVALIDGLPEVMFNADGARALALMAPRPDAQQIVEDLISHANDHGTTSHRFDE